MILRVTENRNVIQVVQRNVTNSIKVTSRENKIVFRTTQRGLQGIQGIQGIQGVPGTPGSAGQGVPTGGTTGQILAKNSNTNYDTGWIDEQDLSGYATTSELATGLAGKANTVHTHTASQVTDFNTAVAANSAVAANTAKISFDSASSSKLAGIEAGADVTDATNVNAAGAVMESDTSTASMAFVVDEDNMASNSATKVPTQQSVKAYVDANAGGAVDSVNGQTGVVVLDADDIDDTSTTHKFTTAGDISKLAGIQAGAEVNVNADWNAVSGDAQILNKPTVSGSNTGDVTLTGTPDYITISGQTITRNPIDLATDVTGDLPFANLTQLSAHQVLARAGSGTGDVAGVTMGNDTILGRAGSGDIDDLSATQVRSIINVANGATANSSDATLLNRANHTGTQTASTISDFATAVAATAAVTANTAKVSNATHTGDVTGATALTIANDAVNNVKLANMAQNTIKGRIASGTGDPEDLTAANIRTITETETTTQLNTRDTNNRARANHTGTQTASTISDFNSASRAQTEAALIAGTNVTITPAGSGATRTLTVSASGGGGGSPAGVDGSIQINTGGSFADVTDFTFDGGLNVPGNIVAIGGGIIQIEGTTIELGAGSGSSATIDGGNVTDNRTYTLPDSDGTLATEAYVIALAAAL